MHAPVSNTNPAEAWQRLQEGNQRYVSGWRLHPRQGADRRAELTQGQQPFAVVLTCSDSRVPPEIIFDQGLGDLFVVRVAGNVVDEAVLASLEYAVAHLHTPLVLVLGHTRCGAISAALAGGPPEGHLPALMTLLEPAVAALRARSGMSDETVDQAARLNAQRMAEQLRAAQPILAPRVHAGTLQIVAACYHLDNGEVELLAPGHPG